MNTVSGKLVVLTGLDGAGKDYVAEYLHQEDAASHIVRTPTPPFLDARHAIDTRAIAVPAAHYLFYLASVVDASARIDRLLAKGNVYCVRYLIDTVAYHRALGLPVELQYRTPLYTLRCPDLTVFLAVDEHVRRARIAARGAPTAGDLLVVEESLRCAIQREYMRLSNHFVTIQNGDRDVAAVVDEIQWYL